MISNILITLSSAFLEKKKKSLSYDWLLILCYTVSTHANMMEECPSNLMEE